MTHGDQTTRLRGTPALLRRQHEEEHKEEMDQVAEYQALGGLGNYLNERHPRRVVSGPRLLVRRPNRALPTVSCCKIPVSAPFLWPERAEDEGQLDTDRSWQGVVSDLPFL